MATYPNATRAFVRRVDRIDLNAADDINDLQDEVIAIQNAVGRNPQVSELIPASTLAERVTKLEQDIMPRVTTLEQRFKRAAVSVKRASTLQVNSQNTWQNVVLPDVVSSLNDYGTAAALYDNAVGRFFSVAPSPAVWTLSASITWYHPVELAVVGVRGLALVTNADTVLAMDKQAALPGEDQTLSISWTGRLPVDPNFSLSLSVKQNQGTALFIQADTATTPFRADYTHHVG